MRLHEYARPRASPHSRHCQGFTPLMPRVMARSSSRGPCRALAKVRSRVAARWSSALRLSRPPAACSQARSSWAALSLAWASANAAAGVAAGRAAVGASAQSVAARTSLSEHDSATSESRRTASCNFWISMPQSAMAPRNEFMAVSSASNRKSSSKERPAARAGEVVAAAESVAARERPILALLVGFFGMSSGGEAAKAVATAAGDLKDDGAVGVVLLDRTKTPHPAAQVK
mmetsp:Transcript_93670/g.269731  ORF Transcript_93670/g.269731 Transcript_93670/m.269731 type:complete len:231 (-) Transcript_93670:237-929(-)